VRDLSAAELLAIRERGRNALPVERALLLLAAAEPDMTAATLASLAIGQRDAMLLRLRARTFGARLDARTACPGCSAALEFEVDTEQLVSHKAAQDVTHLALHVNGYRVQFRVPNSADLRAAAQLADSAAGRALLLERCTSVADAAEAQVAVSALPTAVADAISTAMADADPLADLEFALTCPECGVQWELPLDPVVYFWTEIEAWAQRTLGEVHELARAYGWSEAEILALSPARRSAYLEMVRV
jgi:hypothetical protein